MTTKKKNTILINPWTIGIGSSVFGVLIIRLIDSLTGSKILLTIWSFIKAIIINVFGFFNQEFQWKLYGLIFLFLSGPLIGILILWIISKIQGSNIELSPEWMKYKKDTFDGIIYKWNYKKGYDDKYKIEEIIAYCPKCECQLVDERCPNCKSVFYNQLKPHYELEPLIIHRIEKKST